MKESNKYKVLIFDLDGTAIPNKPDGVPFDALVHVLGELRNRGVRLCAATGRARFNSLPIIQKLGLVDPCIISGGTQIIDPKTEKILWEKTMNKEQVEAIMKIASQYPYHVFFSDDETSTFAKDKIITGPERIIYIEPVDKKDTATIMEQLSSVPDITAHKVISWTPDHFDIHITHAEATKKQALEILLDMMHVHKNEIIAAGDAENDLPLFEVAALKIAMGNASSKLKEKADMIAPNADDDGLTTILNKLLVEA